MNIHSAMSPRPQRAANTDKREAILDAALALFVERGFHGTAVPAVAAKAGVGAGTIYRYFDNKDALVNAVYQQWKGNLSSSVLSGFDSALPPRDLFRHFFYKIITFAKEQPRAFAFLELHHHASYLNDDSRILERRIVDMASALLTHMQSTKVIKPVPVDVLMALVWGGIVGLVRESWQGRFELTDDVLKSAEQCLWESIRL